MFNISSPCAALPAFLSALISQGGGAYLGYMISTKIIFQVRNVDDTFRYLYEYQKNEDFNSYTYLQPQRICPLYSSGDEKQCTLNNKHSQVFLNEFMASFFFYFTWLIIRNYNSDLNDRGLSISSIVKPFIIALVYKGA